MAKQISIKNEIAKEYREKWPKKPTLALARIMYAKNKLAFDGVEDARDKLRYIEGKGGKRKNGTPKSVKDSKFYMAEPRPYNPYNLPESDETSYDPFVIKGHLKIGLLNDIHAPYHNIQALTAAIAFLKKEKVDAVILTEMFDFHGGSKYMKDPRKRKLWEELQIGCDIFSIIHKELKCPIYYKLGNHCERWTHYLWQKMGEFDQLEDLEEIKDLNFHKVLKRRLPNVPITIIDDKRIIQVNSLNVIHGHEFTAGVFNPVNVARGLYLRGKTSAIQGHHHQTSEHTEPDMNGKITTTWSTGCLCELHPTYMPINKWNHGFALINVVGKGFEVKNFRIQNGIIL